mgnify:CR=1 FL=1
MIIAFPPCTYLTFAGNQCLSERLRSKEEIYERKNKRKQVIVEEEKIVDVECEEVIVDEKED